ncbi:transposase [Cucumis melo var. makuwa]|uniref:Transposase n=1 Tax=Cucumis melo var. makuwa TaxID=1194695 RepID=A0A5D3CKP0_CUCMM|nr:transposase [Cucumis melo var. makuwa]TYK12105.1 transposase [Cucumis melo var. makuwa]
MPVEWLENDCPMIDERTSLLPNVTPLPCSSNASPLLPWSPNAERRLGIFYGTLTLTWIFIGCVNLKHNEHDKIECWVLLSMVHDALPNSYFYGESSKFDTHTCEENDVGSVKEMIEVAHEEYSKDPNGFEKLLIDAEKPLKEFVNATECPECSQSRWKNVQDRNEERKQIPSKVIWYFPPIPRFKRLFRSLECAENLTWHASERIEDDKLRHPADSPAWKKYMMLSMLISEPKQLEDDIGTYLAPLIEDLKLLWENGVECYDAYREEVFNLRSVLLWTINDFPAYGNLSGCCVKGYKAFPIYGDNTNSIRLQHGKKIAYLGHRRFLARDHPYRRQKKSFNGKKELGTIPEPLSGEDVYLKLKDLEFPKGKKIHKNLSMNRSVKRFVGIGTLLDISGKSKDGLNARRDLIDLKLRPELAPIVFKNWLTTKYIMPHKDEPQLLQVPPEKYSFIEQNHWEEFVRSRKKRQLQQDTRSKNKYNHRISRKGYGNLKEEMDEISMNTDSSYVNRHCSNDVLTQALGTKEHNGRVRGVGGYVTPTTYFHLVKKTSKDEANILVENEEFRNELKEKKGKEVMKVNEPELDVLKERNLIKMPTEKEVVCESTSTLPLVLKSILRYAEKVMEKDSNITFSLLADLFGISRKTSVLREDIIDLCNMNEVKMFTLVAYMMYLYSSVIGSKENVQYVFVDPSLISSGNTQESRIRNLCSKLMVSKPNQVVLDPFNPEIKLIGEFLLSLREYFVWLKSQESYLHGCPSGSLPIQECVVRRNRQSSMDIDMIRVIRRDPRSPIVLVFPPGSLQTSEGKGRGKLASDKEGSVTCHMGTQFCYRTYVSVF